MKEKLLLAISCPFLLFVGWLGTRLSKQYTEALQDYDFDFEDAR